MCAIIGLGSRRAETDRRWIAIGRDAMQHRGPDDFGEWWSQDCRVGLGHRRLSILDLSSAGHQPMADSSGELCIVFNGEIYNESQLRKELQAKGVIFQSRSDTEVILAAYREWGTACVSRLNGMFAFGLYDSRQQQLFLARDRAGEKPLFYSRSSDALRFSSELKGLMANPGLSRRLDPIALDHYLAEGFVPGSMCILEGVQKLPPAHALTFRLNTGETTVWQYWQVPSYRDEIAPHGPVDIQELASELEQLIEDAVRHQLVADVPIGVLLSGGIDSSLITAFAARAVPSVKTFTVRFPGYGQYDETEHARLIARHYSTEHTELDAREVTVSLLPQLARQIDEPMADSSTVPMVLVSQLIRQHCKVALGGDGGDELFGGYPHYSRLLWIQKHLGFLQHSVRRLIARGSELILPLGFKGRTWLQTLREDFDHDVPATMGLYDAVSRKQLLHSRMNGVGSAEKMRNRRTANEPDLLHRAARFDFQNYLAEDVLVKVDRASMLNGLEVRAPLLDYRVIEFAFRRVPSQLKATVDSRKVLLRRLAAKVLPPQFDGLRKQGFSIPLAAWLQSGPWHKYFQDVLLDTSQTLFDHRVIRGMLDGQRRGVFNDERLFALIMFELWRREYKIEC
jgi:asparagine synthase (glutamine-hydrolysing)